MKFIAVIITCYNRKEKTLKSLEALLNQKELGISFSLEIFLVNDASTDGTKEAIIKKFPQVNIIAGNGDLYWNRGMHLAWKTAAATKDFDFYFWLNDDTYLYNDALAILLENINISTIVCGTTSNCDNITNYGGYRNKKGLITPSGLLEECDYFNGNCVLIPKEVFKLVGNLDPFFHHALGDFDYGIRAKKMKVNLFVAPNYLGTCESHSNIPIWKNPKINILERMKFLYSPLSGCYPIQFFIFDKRLNGISLAILHFFTIHFRVLFPSFFSNRSNKIKGN